MIRRPPRSTRPDTLFPYTTLFRSEQLCGPRVLGVAAALQRDLRIEALDGIAHGQCRPIQGDVVARNAVAAGHLDVLAQTAVRQLACPLQARVGGRRQVAVDAFEVAPPVEVQGRGDHRVGAPPAEALEVAFEELALSLARLRLLG